MSSPNQPPSHQQGDFQDVSSFLNAVDFDKARLGVYKDLPTAAAGSDLEYIYTDLTPNLGAGGGRSFGDELCYGSGTMYLSGLTLGGAWGLREGLQRTKGITSNKLRINGVLNAITRRGPFLGNSAGVLALLYFGVNGTLGVIRGKRDTATSILAATCSGMIFRSTAGLKSAGVSGAIGATLASLYYAGSAMWSRRDQ